MTTTAAATTAGPPTPRRPRRRPAARRWVALLLAAAPALLGAGCGVDGSAVIAPYRSPPPAQVTARTVTGGAGVLALSPDGSLSAVADAVHGVCVSATAPAGTAPAGTAPAGTGSGAAGSGTAGTRTAGSAGSGPAVCADVTLSGVGVVTAAFSADGRWIALGQGVGPQRGGRVWLVDPRSGAARPVPGADGRAVAPTSATGAPPSASSPSGSSIPRSSAPSTRAAAPAPAPQYIGMVWAASGDLLLISDSLDAAGPRTRLVDVDPVSLVPRVVAEATGPYEFQSGYLATGGATVLFTVYRGDQLEPNLVVVDLDSGKRRELGPIGQAGTQLVPLAVSPNGRVAVVGSATLTHPGPPRLLDVGSGVLTEMPGLTGDFGVAAFSPDGARVAVATTGAGSRVSLALVSVSASPLAAARTIGTTAGPLPLVGRMSWSGFDVLSLAGRPVPGPASLVGWRLTS